MKVDIAQYSFLSLCFCLLKVASFAQTLSAISYFTAKNDQVHISFVSEAHPWFFSAASKTLFAWTNKKYRMVYFNFGHKEFDYEGGTHKELSRTFRNETQEQLVTNALLWLGRTK